MIITTALPVQQQGQGLHSMCCVWRLVEEKQNEMWIHVIHECGWQAHRVVKWMYVWLEMRCRFCVCFDLGQGFDNFSWLSRSSPHILHEEILLLSTISRCICKVSSSPKQWGLTANVEKHCHKSVTVAVQTTHFYVCSIIIFTDKCI